VFEERLEASRKVMESEEQEHVVGRIDSLYNDYVATIDTVISLYKEGHRTRGVRIHTGARESFAEILALCRRHKNLHLNRMVQARDHSSSEAARLRVVAAAGMITVFFLGLLLVFVLAGQILEPVRRLAAEAGREGGREKTAKGDDLQSLSKSVRGLIEEYDHAHLELEKSRGTLVQSEKLALVGKLAAGVAHSIRNPLTSVNMRLFSLGRTLQLEGSQKEDFEVISEEIRHIDDIVQNFLEFSRRPRLRIQYVSPSDIVDMTIQLLHHRLRSYDVSVRIERGLRRFQRSGWTRNNSRRSW
jgi:C4-dicarboxylate-specific signal transduction histidine kinase